MRLENLWIRLDSLQDKIALEFENNNKTMNNGGYTQQQEGIKQNFKSIRTS
jgi:hypothetical protein